MDTTTRTRTRRSLPRGLRVSLAAATVLAAVGGTATALPAGALTNGAVGRHVRTDPVLQGGADRLVEAGAVGYVARLRDETGVRTAVAGLADRATGRRMRTSDQFEIGSNTKTFTSTLVLQLVAEGRLRLDDPLERYLPGRFPDGKKITIRMLLNHTSGLFNYTEGSLLQEAVSHPTRRATVEQLLRDSAEHEPYFAPGEGWHYSNTNYVVLGVILNKITGRSLEDLVRDRIARPLGLQRTYFVTHITPYTGPGYAHGYSLAFTDAGPEWTDLSGWSLSWADAAGAIVSTPEELFRFYSALLSGRLLPAAQSAQMRTTVAVPQEWKEQFGGADVGYGLGLMRISTSCGTVWGHGGDTLGHHSVARFSEDGRRGVITDVTTQSKLSAEHPERIAAYYESVNSVDTDATCRMLGGKASAEPGTERS